MYDELENAGQLLELLKNGGDELVVKTDQSELEDRFILGPDLADQVGRKIEIMRTHWRDIEQYLAPPHK
ncbi:hypothetical protein LCGC14_3016290 [marine sediment metagenome]|uniref:Uncharacterized protein n=1 Tax=marine sediment metagenome TaxID=412755 RepID=A0A0F8WX53_9ZZZZ